MTTWRLFSPSSSSRGAGRAEWPIKRGGLPAEEVFSTGHSGESGQGLPRRNIWRPGHGQRERSTWRHGILHWVLQARRFRATPGFNAIGRLCKTRCVVDIGVQMHRPDEAANTQQQRINRKQTHRKYGPVNGADRRDVYPRNRLLCRRSGPVPWSRRARTPTRAANSFQVCLSTDSHQSGSTCSFAGVWFFARARSRLHWLRRD